MQIIMTFFILVNVIIPSVSLYAQAPELASDIVSMIGDLKQLVGQETEFVSQDLRARVEEVKNNIADRGETAIPLLESEIDGEKDGRIRRELVLTLAKIPRERVDRKLLHLFCFDPQVMGTAGSELIWRTEHNGPFTFKVSDEEIQEMIRRIRVEHVFVIGDFMRVLAMCAQNPEEPRLQPILDRFITDIKNPSATDSVTAVGGSYTSPRVFALNKFLLAFRHMGEMVRPYLNEALRKAQEEKDAEVEKWLSMALGITGDREVAAYLKNVVQNDPDRYTRGQAITAYAQSAGRDAIPLLKELFLQDKTESEYAPENSPIRFFISALARGELARLTEEEFQNTPCMRKMADILASKGLTKDNLVDKQDQSARRLYAGPLDTTNLVKTRRINKAFCDQDIEYVQGYINQRRSVDSNDPFALSLEYDINLSFRRYDECLKNIEAMVALVPRDHMPCDKYIIPCILSMVVYFEGTYRQTFLDPENQLNEELSLAMYSLQPGYLFELAGCL